METATETTGETVVKTERKKAPAKRKTATPKKGAKPKKAAAAKKAPRSSAKRKTASAAAPKAEGGARPGSKLAIIVGLLERPEGCTMKEVLAATGWPSVSMPQQAKAAGLTLRKEKDGKSSRYYAVA